MQCVCGRSHLGDVADGMTEFLDGSLPLAGGHAVEDVAPASEAGDFVEVAGVDRHAAEADAGMRGEDFGHGGILVESDDDIARGEDIAHPGGGQGEGVVDEVAFGAGESAFPSALFGKEDYLPVGRSSFGFPPDDGANDDVADACERAQDAAHPVEGKCCVLLDMGAVGDTEILRDHLGNDEDAEGHDGGDQT